MELTLSTFTNSNYRQTMKGEKWCYAGNNNEYLEYVCIDMNGYATGHMKIPLEICKDIAQNNYDGTYEK